MNKRSLFQFYVAYILMLSMVLEAFSSAISASAQTLYRAGQTDSGNENSYVYNEADYDIQFLVKDKWKQSFRGYIMITNKTDHVINDWTLTYQSKNNITIISNAVIESQKNQTYKISNPKGKQEMKAGESVAFTFVANYKGQIDVPKSYELTEKKSTIVKDQCDFTYRLNQVWKNTYSVTVKITNKSKAPIINWKMQLQLPNDITRAWKAEAVKNGKSTYDFCNNGKNKDILVGESVSFGFIAKRTKRTIFYPENPVVTSQESSSPVPTTKPEVTPTGKPVVIPSQGSSNYPSRGSQPTENPEPTQPADEINYDWSQEMINADAEPVLNASKEMVSQPVKVAILDSGVNYSSEVNVVVRKNFVPGYDEEELNPLFDDLSGHGTAVAALIGSNADYVSEDPFNSNVQSDDNRKEKDDKPEEESKDECQESDIYDDSFLLDEEKITLTPQLDEEFVNYLKEQGQTLQSVKISMEDTDSDDTGSDEGAIESGDSSDLLDDVDEIINMMQSTKIHGINPNAEIYSARVLDEFNEAPVSRVIDGINWAINQNVNIINISWGMDEDNVQLHAAIKKAYDNGILIIAAAGNGENVQYPAKYDEVMAAGSITCTSNKAEESATGDEIEIVAPGDNVYSQGLLGIIDCFSGTSVAAPQVTGLASLLWQKDISKSNDFIRQLIDGTANRIGDKQHYGYGLIDCEYAVMQYDTYASQYVKSNIETLDEGVALINDNDSRVETFEEEKVYGSWSNKEENRDGHVYLIPGYASKAVIYGSVWADSQKSFCNSMKINPGFHGYTEHIKEYDYNEDKKKYEYQLNKKGKKVYLTVDNQEDNNYIAAYIYLTEQAKNYVDKGTYKNLTITTGDGIAYMDKIFKRNIHLAWPELANKLGYKVKTEGKGKNKKVVKPEDQLTNQDKAYFVYGLALHSAGDVFAHSAFAFANYRPGNGINENTITGESVKWKRIVHGDTNANGAFKDNRADSAQEHSQRHTCAKYVCTRTFLDTVIKNEIATGAAFVRCKNYPNVNEVGDEDDARMVYLKKGFSLDQLYTNLKNSTSPGTLDYDPYSKRVKGVSLDCVNPITKGWSYLDIRMKDKDWKKNLEDIEYLWELTIKNKKDPDEKWTVSCDRLDRDIHFTTIVDKNKTYIISVKKVKNPDYKKPNFKSKKTLLTTLAISTDKDNCCCIKEIYIEDDGSDTIEKSEDYVVMCKGNTYELSDTDFVSCILDGNVTIADSDGKAGNDSNLEDAKITLTDYNDRTLQFNTVTNKEGFYSFDDLAPGVYIMQIQKEGYLDTKCNVIIRSNDRNMFNSVITMISTKYKGSGNASGTIAETTMGLGVPNLTLVIRKGINELKKKPIITFKSDKEGKYNLDNLEAGHYCIEIKDERAVSSEEKYKDGMFNIIVLGGQTIDDQNGIVTNGHSSGFGKESLRIVLSWEANPLDLDSHLVAPVVDGISTQIYYQNKEVYNENDEIEFQLDTDATDDGSETTIIYPPLDDNYIFYVYNYSHNSAEELMNSDAIVQVFKGNSTIPWQTFYVPLEQGYVWNVFEYHGVDGTLTSLSNVTMTYDK